MSLPAIHRIETAILSARDRGDFEHPLFKQIRSDVPNWITKLSTDDGIAAFESYYQTALPTLVRFYFQNPDIAALLHAGCDLDIFLNDLANCIGGSPPYVYYYSCQPHLVLAFHNHSGGVAAVDLAAVDSPIRYGDFNDQSFDFQPYDSTAVPLASWLETAIRAVDIDQFLSKSRTYPVIRD